MKSPDKFKDVHNLPESGVVEIPEVIIGSESRREAAVLPRNQSDQTDGQDHEDWDVEEGVRSFRKESLGVFEEQSLEFSFSGPPAEHGKENDGEEEADDCSEDLQAIVMRPEAK